MVRHLFMVLATVAVGLSTGTAHAASCADRDTVVKRLKSQYDEAFSAGGLQTIRDKQTLVEVWSSQKTGTFTVMLTTPDGLACVVATGTDWHQVDAAAVPQGSES